MKYQASVDRLGNKKEYFRLEMLTSRGMHISPLFLLQKNPFQSVTTSCCVPTSAFYTLLRTKLSSHSAKKFEKNLGTTKLLSLRWMGVPFRSQMTPMSFNLSLCHQQWYPMVSQPSQSWIQITPPSLLLHPFPSPTNSLPLYIFHPPILFLHQLHLLLQFPLLLLLPLSLILHPLPWQ